MSPDKPSCENCTAGLFEDNQDVGSCRHRPPVAVLRPVTHENKLTKNTWIEWEPAAIWPAVRRTDWCRKHAGSLPVLFGSTEWRDLSSVGGSRGEQ